MPHSGDPSRVDAGESPGTVRSAGGLAQLSPARANSRGKRVRLLALAGLGLAAAAVVASAASAPDADRAIEVGSPPARGGGQARQVERDTFHTYVVKFVAGRTDGTTVRPGALTVWADGADTPAINLQQINTLQRYNGVTQKWMQLWEGDYTRGLQQTSTQSFVLTRIGGTLAEAIADRPIATGSNASGQFYTGSGPNLGAPSARAITSRTANQSLIPPSLGGKKSSKARLPTRRVTLTPNWVSPFDGASSNYQNVWVYARSRTTPYRSPDECHCRGRYLLLDPRVTDSDGRAGRDEWWFVIERNWPSSFDPKKHGEWGRLVNFHNVQNDVGWDTGNGVSALALDWVAAPAPQFTLEYHDGGKPHYLRAVVRKTAPKRSK